MHTWCIPASMVALMSWHTWSAGGVPLLRWISASMVGFPTSSSWVDDYPLLRCCCLRVFTLMLYTQAAAARSRVPTPRLPAARSPLNISCSASLFPAPFLALSCTFVFAVSTQASTQIPCPPSAMAFSLFTEAAFFSNSFLGSTRDLLIERQDKVHTSRPKCSAAQWRAAAHGGLKHQITKPSEGTPFLHTSSYLSALYGDDLCRRHIGLAPASSMVRSPFFMMDEDSVCASTFIREHPSSSTSSNRGHQAGVPVYVMLPLNSVTLNNTVSRKRAMNASLAALKSAGVEGVMMDVWWDIVEKEGPGMYNWSAYKELIDMVKKHGLKVQAVMSFHQCGGNVGDSCFIPLPRWVAEEIDQNQDLVYTDRQGRRNYEYLSLGCDTIPVLNGRSPVQVYSDYMRSFRDTFGDVLGDTIVEIQVGMGPAGELRYPSYPESNGTWRFPGIGEFQCYDKYMLSSLKAAAECIGKPQWGHGGPSDAAHYNSWPEESRFFCQHGGWDSPYGRFFLEWYSGMLLAHGERIAASAANIFRGTGVTMSGKVAGIHWHYKTRSHAAELTAGYYNTRLRDGYLPIARMFGRHGAVLNFTCIEMKDMEQPQEAKCSPENLIRQVVLAARHAEVLVGGENALPRFDDGAHRQIVRNSRLALLDDPQGVQYEPMCAFTFLRMSEALFQSDNWRNFVAFVRQMAEGRASVNAWQEQQRASESLVRATRPLIQEVAAALAHH